MKDMKLLWNLLEKYDSDKGFKTFCDSLSLIIQGKQTDDDLVNIIQFRNIPVCDMNLINDFCDIESVFF